MNKLKHLLGLIMLVMVPFVFTACESDDDDDANVEFNAQWFGGKSFVAFLDAPELWDLEFNANKGAGRDGYFTVTPRDENGNIDSRYKVYTGQYQIDIEQRRIYIAYDGYSMNEMWSFYYDNKYNNDPYYPGIVIQSSTGTSGVLSKLTFYPY